MPARIDTNLLPPVIRERVDPEILDRAQSIEWTINRDTGQSEHGFMDGSHEDYLSSQNLMFKSHAGAGGKQVDWLQSTPSLKGGRDSGFEQASPGTPSLGRSTQLDHADDAINFGPDGASYTSSQISGNKHPIQYSSGAPFPIYKVNHEQLQGDVFFEKAPKARPGERTVHYEKASRIMKESELEALGLDPKLFGPNSNTNVNEQQEETIESSALSGSPEMFRQLYESMRNDAGQYFDDERARSVGGIPLDGEESMKRTVIFGSLEELNNREQEYFPYRDAHQGKPLPGDNEYGTWGSRRDEERQWKLCNGSWVRVAEPKPAPPEPEQEQYMAERIKCKPPKRIQVARAEPVKLVEPDRGSTDSADSGDDEDSYDKSPSLASLDVDQEPLDLVDLLDKQPPLDRDRSPPRGERSYSPPPLDLDPYDDLADLVEQPIKPRRAAPRRPLAAEPDAHLDALKDRYKPKPKSNLNEPKSNAPLLDDNNKQPGTILLKPPTPPVEEIKCEPITPTYVEMKKPLKHEGEEEKMMEDPNLMWIGMGPAQYGPPYGTLKKRKAREEEWIGPPCELCHKQIEERRCMLAENRKFHCWHFSCSHCFKTLQPSDFLIAERDKKPYCLNCHKREFPEISLLNLNLQE